MAPVKSFPSQGSHSPGKSWKILEKWNFPFICFNCLVMDSFMTLYFSEKNGSPFCAILQTNTAGRLAHFFISVSTHVWPGLSRNARSGWRLAVTPMNFCSLLSGTGSPQQTDKVVPWKNTTHSTTSTCQRDSTSPLMVRKIDCYEIIVLWSILMPCM